LLRNLVSGISDARTRDANGEDEGGGKEGGKTPSLFFYVYFHFLFSTPGVATNCFFAIGRTPEPFDNPI
jgi:hypothetical protein